MFAAKSTLFLAIFAASAHFAAATPPYCILSALTGIDSPQKVKICTKGKADFKDDLESMCEGDFKKEALDYFAEVCKGYSSSSSSSSAASSTGTETGSSTESESVSVSASATSAPYPITYTTTYFDSSCSCNKTAAISSTGVVAPTIAGSASPSGTGFTGSASKNLLSCGAAIAAFAGLVMAL